MIGSAIERQNSEERLQQQFEELQKTNHELDSFVYSVSHDLRAPLSTILGLINIAEKDEQPANWPTYLQHIRNSINRLDNFIKEILTYSRNTRTHVESEPIDIALLVSEARNNTIPIDSNVLFKEKFDPDHQIFSSDRKRLLVILNNLLSNAYKFRNERKPKCYINVDCHRDQKHLVLRVTDNGIGIESKHLPNVFEIFYRATDRNPGSGLGLYIAKETVSKLGGTIHIESEAGEFTRVTVRLPVD
jgi:signal transduction histidine kinase